MTRFAWQGPATTIEFHDKHGKLKFSGVVSQDVEFDLDTAEPLLPDPESLKARGLIKDVPAKNKDQPAVTPPPNVPVADAKTAKAGDRK
jgi:hypothetical protein